MSLGLFPPLTRSVRRKLFLHLGVFSVYSRRILLESLRREFLFNRETARDWKAKFRLFRPLWGAMLIEIEQDLKEDSERLCSVSVPYLDRAINHLESGRSLRREIDGVLDAIERFDPEPSDKRQITDFHYECITALRTITAIVDDWRDSLLNHDPMLTAPIDESESEDQFSAELMSQLWNHIKADQAEVEQRLNLPIGLETLEQQHTLVKYCQFARRYFHSSTILLVTCPREFRDVYDEITDRHRKIAEKLERVMQAGTVCEELRPLLDLCYRSCQERFELLSRLSAGQLLQEAVEPPALLEQAQRLTSAA